MTRTLYELLTDDMAYADRWFLGAPIGQSGAEIDPRLFTYGEPYSGEPPAVVPIRYAGRVVRFNLASFDMPVVSRDVAETIKEVSSDAVESFPIAIEGKEQEFSILNVLLKLACVDEQRSRILRWTDEDGRPDKVGQYRMVTNLTIDPRKAQEHDIFRIDGWELALIASDKLWQRLKEHPDLGVRASRVT